MLVLSFVLAAVFRTMGVVVAIVGRVLYVFYLQMDFPQLFQLGLEIFGNVVWMKLEQTNGVVLARQTEHSRSTRPSYKAWMPYWFIRVADTLTNDDWHDKNFRVGIMAVPPFLPRDCKQYSQSWFKDILSDIGTKGSREKIITTISGENQNNATGQTPFFNQVCRTLPLPSLITIRIIHGQRLLDATVTRPPLSCGKIKPIIYMATPLRYGLPQQIGWLAVFDINLVVCCVLSLELAMAGTFQLWQRVQPKL